MFQTVMNKNKLFILLLISTFGFLLRANAAAPTYSVSVGGGSFSPNPIYTGMTATASLTGSLNVQNSSQEVQESGDSWKWSASVTAYAPNSQTAFGPVPSGVTPPVVSASSGSTTSTVTATASQTTTAGCYQVTVTATDSFTLTDSSTKPATVTSQSQSGSTILGITVAVPSVTITLGSNVQRGQSITGTIALSNPNSLPGSITVGLSASNAPPPNPQTNPATPSATGMVTLPSSVTVPGNGSSVSFTVTGSAVSAFLNDVYIAASNGGTSSKVSLTVWDVGTPTCTATPADPYFITNDGTTTTLSAKGPVYNDLAVNLNASATIVPASAPLSWISSAYPSGTQIGMVQNMENGTYIVSYSNPQPIWNSNVPKGTVGYSWTGWTYTTKVPASVDTTDNSSYPRPYGPLVSISTPWSDTDSPSTQSGTFGTEALLASDNTTVLGSVTYSLTVLSVSAAFSDWCCIVNSTTTFPATTGWSISVSGSPPASGSSTPTGKSVTIGGGGGSPITSGYDTNQYLNDYAGIDPPTTSPSPLVRTSFTR